MNISAHSACVLTIGDELLNGDVENTNASWLARSFRRFGIPCRTMFTVADRHREIIGALRYLWKDHDLIVVTGGLGPTRDDVTKAALLDFFDDTLIRNVRVLEHVREYFRKRGRRLTDVNRRQADVPAGATVLFNELGTAPGLLIEHDGKMLAAMPGVPYELHHITLKQLIPEIEKRWHKSERRVHQTYFRTTGIGESDLSDIVLKDLGSKIPASVDIAFLPHPKGVDIRVTEVNGAPENGFEVFVDWIRQTASEFIFSEDYGESLGDHIVNALSSGQETVAIAESCTGGYLANTLTDTAGSSTCFKGGIIAYDNRIKTEVLGVNPESIEQEGAVSARVALEMARKAGEIMKADYGISTTGIAGPGGGTVEKPVGTVWIGFWSRTGTHFACRYQLTTQRPVNKERSCAVALDILRRHIMHIDGMPHKPEIVYP